MQEKGKLKGDKLIMYHSYSYNATTYDNKNVSLCVQTINGLDVILAQDIINYVRKHFNVGVAINNSDPQINTATFIDGNKANRKFLVGFALTYDNQFQKVIDANLISLIETM